MVDATSNLNFTTETKYFSVTRDCDFGETFVVFGLLHVDLGISMFCAAGLVVSMREMGETSLNGIFPSVFLYISTTTEMGYIESLVENENSAKMRRKEILSYYNMLDLFWHIFIK